MTKDLFSLASLNGRDMDDVQWIARVLQWLDMSHAVRQQLERAVRQRTGLTLEQAVAMCRIDLAGGSATISAVASGISRAAHTASARIDSLERKGLVRRERHPGEDQRRVHVIITPKGRERLHRYRREASALLRSLVDDPASSTALTFLHQIDALTSSLPLSPQPPPRRAGVASHAPAALGQRRPASPVSAKGRR